MKKKFVIILLIAVFAFVLLAGCNQNKTDYDTEIIVNGDFENYNTQESKADTWTVQSGTKANWGRNINDGSNEYDSSLGKYYFYLDNVSSSYQYIYQTIRLEKNATYRLSANVRVDKLSGTAGIYFDGAIETTGIVLKSTTDGWEEQEMYFTSTVSGEVVIVVAVGLPDTKATGSVYFDNISLQKVNGVDEDTPLSILKMKEGYTMADGGSTTFVVLFTLLSAGFCVAMFFLIKSIIKNKPLAPNNGTTKADKFLNTMTGNSAQFLYVLLACFAIRFIIVLASAEANDLVASWVELAKGIADKGFVSYYSNSTYESQGIIWMLGIIGYVGKALSFETVGYAILIRMPAVIADIAICYALYSVTAKYQNERMATAYGFIYAVLPVFFIVGSLYGSLENIAMAFLLLMAISMLNKKYISTGVYYTLALFFSNYALILLPVILLYQIYGLVKDKSSVTKTVVTMVVSFVAFYLLSLPLCWAEVSSGNVLFVFKKMYGFFNAANPLLSDNTFNLYAIFASADKARSSNLFFEMGNWLLVIAMSGFSIFHYIRTANRLDLILLSAITIIAYSALGTQASLEIMPIGLLLLLLYIILTPDIRLFVGFSSLATLAFMNIAQYISQSGFISGTDNAGWLSFESKSAFMIIFSILTVGMVFFLIYVMIDITLNSYVKPIAVGNNNELEEQVLSENENVKTKTSRPDKKSKKSK